MTVDALVGRSVVTLESTQNPDLPTTPFLKALQAAFIDEQAAQCGYCTSGLLISAAALLMSAQETVSDLQIREALEPHLCRCGTHNRVLRAVKKAALQGGLIVTPSEVSA
jgi:nicotinate dehydrogenase subunit A